MSCGAFGEKSLGMSLWRLWWVESMKSDYVKGGVSSRWSHWWDGSSGGCGLWGVGALGRSLWKVDLLCVGFLKVLVLFIIPSVMANNQSGVPYDLLYLWNASWLGISVYTTNVMWCPKVVLQNILENFSPIFHSDQLTSSVCSSNLTKPMAGNGTEKWKPV